MAKKKGKTKSKAAPGKSKLAMLSQIVSSYRPKKVGLTYVKETLDALVKQVGYQQQPLKDLMKDQEKIDGSRFKPLDAKQLKTRGAAFTSWLLKHAPKCLVNDAFEFNWGGLAEGSGVVAKRTLKRHEPFIRIPRKLMITSTQASQSPLGQVMMKDEAFGTMPNLMLAVHLMFESLNPDSFYRPYLDVLPRQLPLPLFFTSEELKELKGSSTYYDALKIQKQTLRQYVLTTKILDARATSTLKLPPFTFRDFAWAVGVVMTRQNRIPAKSDKKKHVLALIPGWDFCNFRSGELTTHFNDDIDCSESFTMNDVKTGSQVFIYYGKRPNSKLLLFNGFVPDDNKEDFVEVMFTAEESKTEDEKKIRKLLLDMRRLKLSQPICISANGKPSAACITWLRICSCDKQDAILALKAKKPQLEKLSERNENEAIKLLRENVTRVLKGYPTTLEQDLKQIDNEKLSPNVRLAIRLRIKEKEALHKCLTFDTRQSTSTSSETKTAVVEKKE
mmetsp:Transcript_1430/g.2026  ORF Transcript_1430/g.2026 Transcript_1430/m.2026 type:complete len:503 (-) Transcript_1430:138-1646(-)|eukprot:CAMPEP_0167755302 /NCGR_PEP_ID=MMETSP0110_2-20121227/8747_1 /TAXON_ID=629695 /ORGANISM="Gymnochlora sp., Strain CCMP2014" /LENGTH=502 /DNA_ID=CAMNT_0007641271 /DNA_START=76 /DNA_END=1584 /DNA_ORIENTATION=-